jgi:hypothetical protein
MKKWHSTMGGLVALLALAGARLMTEPPDDTTGPSPTTLPESSVEAGETSAPLVSPSTRATHATDAPASAPEKPANYLPTYFDPDEAREKQRERRAKAAAFFEEVIAEEAHDEAWRAELTRRARTALTLLPMLSGVKLDGVQCGQTLCRADFTFDEEKRSEVEGMLHGVGAALGADAFSYGEDAHDRVAVYLTRPGASLPIGKALASTR